MLALAEAIGEIAGAKDSGSRPGRISRIFSGFLIKFFNYRILIFKSTFFPYWAEYLRFSVPLAFPLRRFSRARRKLRLRNSGSSK